MAAPVAKRILKRKSSSPDSGDQTGPAPAKKSGPSGGGHWALGLTASMNDPELKVDEDDKVVIIKDKYPKARFHYLVIPKEHIASLKNLTRDHLPLLKHMQRAGEEIAEKTGTNGTFLCGYHAVPSMSQLHMHVISDDFDSECLKTKKHWNSFTTEYFVKSQDLMRLLEDKGSVSYDAKHHADLLKQSLRCHVCKKEMTTMPALKTHIKSHIKKS